MKNKLMKPSIDHYTIEGVVLCSERETTGLSQAAFTEECGHSQQYQQQIETPGSHRIRSVKAEQILAVIGKYK